MDIMEKRLIVGLFVFVALVAIFIFSSEFNSTGNYLKVEENNVTGGVSSAVIKEFNMTAKNWEFNPSTISVKLGDRVVIHVKSIDVEHGIALPAFGISQNLNPGEEVTLEFVADQKGEFTFFCNVYCGAGHREMKGTLVVN